MAQHKALTAALRLLKKRGLSVYKAGTLELAAHCREYNPRALYVQISCSAHDDHTAKFKVSWLHETHTEYAKYKPLDGLEFVY